MSVEYVGGEQWSCVGRKAGSMVSQNLYEWQKGLQIKYNDRNM